MTESNGSRIIRKLLKKRKFAEPQKMAIAFAKPGTPRSRRGPHRGHQHLQQHGHTSRVTKATAEMRKVRCRDAVVTVAVCTAVATHGCLAFQISTNMPHLVAVLNTGRGATRPLSTVEMVGDVEARGWGRIATAGFNGGERWDVGRRKVLHARRDGDESGNFAQGFEQSQPYTEVMRSDQPRRYLGEDAGLLDDHGVGGPRGDGRGRKWTVELCGKRLALLHRKLRQVKDLRAKQARDPDSLDDAQLTKIDRRMDLQLEIAELEGLRRDLIKAESEGGDVPTYDPVTGSRSTGAVSTAKLPPGPFAGVSKVAPVEGDSAPEQAAVDDGAQYTRDGIKLASPRRPEKSAGTTSAGSKVTSGKAGQGPAERQTIDSVGTDFRWDAGFDGEGGAMSGEDEIVQYPKRLATAMSFCRVSTKATCEVLIALGRVTVNGKTADDPMQRVDVLADEVVCNGVTMTLPPKIDNSDENKKQREDLMKRSGPIPKADKNTWKAKVKYHWGTDDGLLATRTRRAANAKASQKKHRGGGGRGGGDYY